ncbi:MAG: hypothetical protein GY711_02800 [bacterium]|nr:hypothetical protein [bacterium]
MEAKPNCTHCRYFFVTYEPKQPRGCRAYGFKSLAMPTAVVLETSGADCKQFEPRPRGPRSPLPGHVSG